MRFSAAAWIAAATILFLGLVAVIVRLAWISDDAYITLRTVENFVGGFGPVWNVHERVQTYTHPLWMLLLAVGRWLTGEHYFTTIGLGLGLSLTAAVLVARLGSRLPSATAVLALLLCSRAFTEYATSGLETSLVCALLAGLAIVWQRELLPERRLLATALATGLLMTTRMDLAVIAGPCLCLAMYRCRLWPALSLTAIGLSPFLLWSAFATIYYGTPLPITAYAKAVCVGIPAIDLLAQGCHYAVAVAMADPLTMAVIAAGVATGLMAPKLGCRALALGALLYSAYVMKVGGDFMVGRFFVPPFFIATAILARGLAGVAETWSLATVVGAAVLLFVPGAPAFLHAPAKDGPPTEHYHGVIDERSFYYGSQGLLSPKRDIPEPGRFTEYMHKQMGRTRPVVVTRGQIGRYGFEAGELAHLVDPWLCDPLLMRLPTWNTAEWRIGHFVRHLPEGYLETIATGKNQLVHPGVRRYYEALRAVISEPVFDLGRLVVTFELLTGVYDGDLDTYVRDEYRRAPRVRIAAAELAAPRPVGSYWCDDPQTRVIYDGGVAVLFDRPMQASTVTLRVLGGAYYTLRFMRNDEVLGTVHVDATAISQFAGLQEMSTAVPPEVGRTFFGSAMWSDFTAIWIDVPNPNSELVACLGGLRLEK